MKRITLLCFSLLAAICLQAQNVPYHVVFDITSKDTNDQKMVLRWVDGITKERPDAKLEIVLYGLSLDMIHKDRSVVAPALKQALENKNVSVKVCAVAMKRHNIEASQLLPGVTIVPDGIYQIITRQKEGWGYIKVAH